MMACLKQLGFLIFPFSLIACGEAQKATNQESVTPNGWELLYNEECSLQYPIAKLICSLRTMRLEKKF